MRFVHVFSTVIPSQVLAIVSDDRSITNSAIGIAARGGEAQWLRRDSLPLLMKGVISGCSGYDDIIIHQ